MPEETFSDGVALITLRIVTALLNESRTTKKVDKLLNRLNEPTLYLSRVDSSVIALWTDPFPTEGVCG